MKRPLLLIILTILFVTGIHFAGCGRSGGVLASLPGWDSLDTSFGTNGTVTTDLGSGVPAYAFAVAIQSDGKIVAVGSTSTHFALARYNTDGSLDTGFGTGGIVTAPSGAANAVAIQSDGKIVAAGSSSTYFALVRYNTDGSLDTSFGTNGIVTTLSGGAGAVAIQSDGKIVAVGSSSLVRYNTDGRLDTSFGTNGIVTTPPGTASVAVQADGKIVAAWSSSSGSSGFALERYNTDGSLDASFGTNGIVTTLSGGASAVAIQSDGMIVAAGSSTYPSDFTLARYSTGGSLDTRFGTSGKAITDFGSANDTLRAIAIQIDGKIVTAGQSATASRSVFALTRYNTDGSLDTTFGANGRIAVGTRWAGAHAVALQTDGKIVAAGYSYTARYAYKEGHLHTIGPPFTGNPVFTLTRYLP